MKLGLGTAQFGLDYGVSNSRGKVSIHEGRQILELARSAHIDLIDTAPAYGDSEEALGTLLKDRLDFRVVTKTHAVINSEINSNYCAELGIHFRRSLSRPGRKCIYGLLIHQADDLLAPGGQQLISSMQSLVREGLVEKIGVSVYTGNQIDRVLELFTPDIVQLPINLFDQRLIRSGHLERLHSLGVEIHARSIFLQGLLLMDPKSLHPYFAGVRNHLSDYREFLQREGLHPVGMAIEFIQNQPQIDTALVGVSAASELKEILNASLPQPKPGPDWQRFAVNDEAVLNPSRWKLT